MSLLVGKRLRFGALPKREQRGGEALGLDPVGRIEVMSFREGLDREVGEDRGQPVGHPPKKSGLLRPPSAK